MGRVFFGALLILAGFVLPLGVAAQSIPLLMELGIPAQGDRFVRLTWGTEPGIRYQLLQSSDLEVWAPVDADPVEAEDLALERLFELSGGLPQFVRVLALDEQPPALRGQWPQAGDIGVPLTGTLSVWLDDLSAIDPASIRVQVDGHGPFTVNDPQITLEGHEIRVFLGEDVQIGNPGETVEVQLEAADVLGNAGSWSWTFELEREPGLIDGLFVFGSEAALEAGQILNPAAEAVALQVGVPMRILKSNSGEGWSLEQVEEDRIEIRYNGSAPELFAVGQLLANLTPTHVQEIFYRRITGIQTGLEEGLLVLQTEAVGLPVILEESTFQVGADGILLEADAEGALSPLSDIFQFSGGVQTKDLLDGNGLLRGIQWDLSGQSWSLGAEGTVHLEDASISLCPRLFASVETKLARLEQFHARVETDLEVELLARWSGEAAIPYERSQELGALSHWIWKSVGGVPVGVEVTTTLTGRARLELTDAGEVRAGFNQEGRFGVYGGYMQEGDPRVSWNRWDTMRMPEQSPVAFHGTGWANAALALVPRMDIRVFGLAGIQVTVDPRAEFVGTATWNGEQGGSEDWIVGAHADLNANLHVLGEGDEDLPRLPSETLFSGTWRGRRTADPIPPSLGIRRQPESMEVLAGAAFQLSVEAEGPGALTYQWYRNDVALPGRTHPNLTFDKAQFVHDGIYFVRVRSGSGVVDSQEVHVTVIHPTVQSPCEYPDTYPYAEGDPTVEDPWQFFQKESMSYVAWKINEHAGTTSEPLDFRNRMQDGHFHSAVNWAANAVAIGFQVDETPAAGAIAHWGAHEGAGALGHVAWVERVNEDGSVRVSEYNWPSGMNGYEKHRFNVRCSVRPPRFIHLFPAGQGPLPASFARIPAGTFEMGDSLGDFLHLTNPPRPVHTVEVSAFIMARTHVTKAGWDEVRTWAANHGYTDLRPGFGKGANHPVLHVSWYDATKWCNAASERMGLMPVYRLNGAVYRKGNWNPGEDPGIEVQYGANGYRLPTEAEWEKAARGGLEGQRFPWGDTISHAQANYTVYREGGSANPNNFYAYDISPTWGAHPSYMGGGHPYTSPVGRFAANGYGLYDMAGNVRDWCNDWMDDGSYYANSPFTDPRGTASGERRVHRGGDWALTAPSSITAGRGSSIPDMWDNSVGFRWVRSYAP